MFQTLLESRSRTEAHAGGTIASITAHGALIAAAVIATAQARIKPREAADPTHVLYFPSQPVAAPARTAEEPRTGSSERPTVPQIDTRRIDLSVPSIEINNTLSAPVEFAPRSIGGSGSSANENTAVSDGVFEANQVEKQVSLIGSAAPRYPEVLRTSGVEGQVTAEFVVDEKGRAEADSVRFVRSDNLLFQEAVKAVLPRMRFVPAEVGGRKVRQLVRMPFVFTLGR